MSANRLDEIMSSRHAKAPVKLDRDTATDLRVLTERPEWRTLLAYLGCKLDAETVDRDAPNPSALLLIEGRRSLFRELQRLSQQVNDDDRSRAARPE